MEIKRIRKDIKHQGIGGKIFTIDEQVSSHINLDEVYNKAILEGNPACINFMNRRPDILELFTMYEDPVQDPYTRMKIGEEIVNTKVLYGHVDGLGYVVTENEVITEGGNE